jgi:hypothetical protein
MKAHISEITGLADPPIADCIKLTNAELKCPYRIDTESEFDCIPDNCQHLSCRKEELRRSMQVKF